MAHIVAHSDWMSSQNSAGVRVRFCVAAVTPCLLTLVSVVRCDISVHIKVCAKFAKCSFYRMFAWLVKEGQSRFISLFILVSIQ